MKFTTYWDKHSNAWNANKRIFGREIVLMFYLVESIWDWYKYIVSVERPTVTLLKRKKTDWNNTIYFETILVLESV